MKIIGLTSNRNGYRGFIEDNDEYIYFVCRKNGKFRKLMRYKKENFTNIEHFAGIMTKFAPSSFFLKDPVSIPSLTIAELDRL